jgi:hypothetical protein
MTKLLRGGRGGDVRLKLYLSILWFAGGFPYDVTYPARAWAGLLDLPDPGGNGARRITDGLRVERRPGFPARVFLLSDSGTGEDYRPPGDVVEEMQAADHPPNADYRRNTWVVLPATFWTKGWLVVLPGVAIAMWLALLSELGGDRPGAVALWFSPFQAKERFGLSEDSRSAGFNALEQYGLVTSSRRSINPDVWDFRRMRKVYRMRPTRLGRRPGEETP